MLNNNWFLTTHSPTMKAVYEQLELALRADLCVLITGETGVGKGVLAKLLHSRLSARGGEFVTVDGTVLSQDQPEAELFGIIPRFATNVDGKMGLIHRAIRGTLFFDEIGDLPLLLQRKLLRLIEERLFRRVGASAEESADVRFIFATNCDLIKMIAEGSFRSDLYYRIQQVRIHLPALRERSEDILPLMQHLCKTKARAQTPPSFTAELADLLRGYSWPGNIRELVSCAENLLLRQQDQEPLSAALLPADLYDAMKRDSAQSRPQHLFTIGPPTSSNPHFERVPRRAFIDTLLSQHIPNQRTTVLLQSYRGGGRTVARQLAQLVERPVLWLVDTANEKTSPSLFFERLIRDTVATDLNSFDRWLRDKVKKEPELLIIQTEPRGPEELLEDVASVVRSLLEEYAGLHFLIIGGERLLRMRRHERYSWRGLLPPNSFVDVPDLTEAEIRRILNNRRLPTDAAALLHTHTGGHPWLIFELISKQILREEDVLIELTDQLDQSGLLDRHLDDPSARDVLQRLANRQSVAPLSEPSIRRNPRHPESRLYFDGLLTTNQKGETIFRCQAITPQAFLQTMSKYSREP